MSNGKEDVLEEKIENGQSIQRAQTNPKRSPKLNNRPWLPAPAASSPSLMTGDSNLYHSEAAHLLSTGESFSIGFASKKRNDDFHELFPGVNKTELLLEGELFFIVLSFKSLLYKKLNLQIILVHGKKKCYYKEECI
jgi:hypothetical protein